MLHVKTCARMTTVWGPGATPFPVDSNGTGSNEPTLADVAHFGPATAIGAVTFPLHVPMVKSQVLVYVMGWKGQMGYVNCLVMYMLRQDRGTLNLEKVTPLNLKMMTPDREMMVTQDRQMMM